MSLSAELNAAAPHDPTASPALQAAGLAKAFVSRKGLWSKAHRNVALADIAIDLRQSEILAVVGESGSGKTTLGRLLVGLETADAGWVRKGDLVLMDVDRNVFVPPSKRGIGLIFQDPNSSLNPRMRVRDIVGEGLRLAGVSARDARERVAHALDLVGLQRADMERYPHQFSGGQRQRIGIARAIVMEPTILIADEAVSSLDVSVQMQILNLVLDLRDKLKLAVIFISHNIGVVEYLCDRVIVLSQGRIVERGATAQIIADPQHPYTQRLLAAVPKL